MTHSAPMPDSAGTFAGEKPCDDACRKCKAKQVVYSKWESSCGGYEDYKYRCNTCGHVWWEEGIDS